MRAGIGQRRGPGFRLGVVAAALVLVTGACSSDRSEDPDDGSTGATADLPTDTFGDLESPCRDGDGGPATGAVRRPTSPRHRARAREGDPP